MVNSPELDAEAAQGNAQVEVIVLAAGQGTRMRSSRPKVLHELAGRSLLSHVLDTVTTLEPAAVHVVVGHQAQAVQAATAGDVHWVVQADQLGTGHAVGQALPDVDDERVALVVFGDVPLVTAATLDRCVAAAADGSLALVTARFDDPAELGRIVRDPEGTIQAIVEYRDADAAQRQINEINSGIMALNAATMKRLLEAVVPRNVQAEYYLTDLVALAVAGNIAVVGVEARFPEEVAGINDRVQLAELERHYQRLATHQLMLGGVSMADPTRVDIRGELRADQDCYIDVNVVFEGSVTLERGVRIGSGCVIKDAQIGAGTVVAPNTVIDGAEIGERCEVGPFARMRPGTSLGEAVKIGNFVETKKARLGAGSKASHLTYLGDTEIGEHCNVGAGTVTCNYDGINKHPTRIGDRVFVGTNTTLVAPLDIDSDAFIAAGSTITTRVGEAELGVGRSRQRNIQGWTRPDHRTPTEDN